MSENYFYSSLSAQEIEDTLVGAVVYNSDQALTTSQKAQARANIGAGENDTKVIIMGFFDTLADLQSQIPVGTAGDVYAVGTQSPYDIFIWDATHTEWKDNGPLSFSDAIIDDGDISLSSTWSSQKINTQLSGKQATISAVGMLKGTGSAVEAATKGTDYGALSFTVTLAAASWSSNAQTVSNANFLASGYAYIVSPASASFAAYGEAQIYADDVSTDGSMVFHCDSAPSSDLTVNIVRVVSA
jgi:hypothetical protein